MYTQDVYAGCIRRMYTQDVVIGYYYKRPTNQAKRARLVGFCSRIIYISVGAAKDGTRTRDMSPASMKFKSYECGTVIR